MKCPHGKDTNKRTECIMEEIKDAKQMNNIKELDVLVRLVNPPKIKFSNLGVTYNPEPTFGQSYNAKFIKRKGRWIRSIPYRSIEVEIFSAHVEQIIGILSEDCSQFIKYRTQVEKDQDVTVVDSIMFIVEEYNSMFINGSVPFMLHAYYTNNGVETTRHFYTDFFQYKINRLLHGFLEYKKHSGDGLKLPKAYCSGSNVAYYDIQNTSVVCHNPMKHGYIFAPPEEVKNIYKSFL